MKSTLRTVVLALVVSALFATPAFAQDEQTPTFKFAGEEFYYSIQLNGVEAIRVSVRAGDVKYRKGRPYVPISGIANSTGFFDAVYSVRDKANTFIHPKSYRPMRSQKFFNENGDEREYHVDFTHSTYKARVKKVKKKRERKFTMAVPGTTHDMISWFYDLRTREEFHVGKVMTFYVYDGWKLSRITGRIAKKEDVYTPMGWFKAWRIDFDRDVLRSRRQRNKEPIMSVKTQSATQASLWVSRDENRLPIKVRVSTSMGTGEAVIIKYKPANANKQ